MSVKNLNFRFCFDLEFRSLFLSIGIINIVIHAKLNFKYHRYQGSEAHRVTTPVHYRHQAITSYHCIHLDSVFHC